MISIEPGILPLVDALNATGLVQTFSSCEGHFDLGRLDQQHGEVRFIPVGNTLSERVETALGSWLMAYKKKHGLLPVRVIGYKLFTPVDDSVDVTFVLELHPFNRFDPPATKRVDVDRAVLQVASLVILTPAKGV